MLEEKTALVTGGTCGIGKAIVLELIRQKANVAVIYRTNTSGIDEITMLVEKEKVKTACFPCDVAVAISVERAMSEITATFGGVDILVNNAGIIRDQMQFRMENSDWDEVLNINLKGAFHCIRAVAPYMMRKRIGRILNISSVVGLNGQIGQANYAASKAGLIGLTKSVARELARYHVTCNAIAPGYIETDMTKILPQDRKKALLCEIPLKRMGRPEDVVALASFLASDSAGYITGETIRIDGGLCM